MISLIFAALTFYFGGFVCYFICWYSKANSFIIEAINRITKDQPQIKIKMIMAAFGIGIREAILWPWFCVNQMN